MGILDGEKLENLEKPFEKGSRQDKEQFYYLKYKILCVYYNIANYGINW